MASFIFSYYSKILNRSTTAYVILPENKRDSSISIEDFCSPSHRFKTLWLLHGGGHDYSEWERKSRISALAHRYSVAVITPDARNSNYGDEYREYPGAAFYPMWTHMNDELMQLMRFYFPLSAKREDNYVAGMSMGGNGAAHWAFSYPEKSEGAAIISAALRSDLKLWDDLSEEAAEDRKRMMDYYGGNKELAAAHDHWYLAKKLSESKTPPPRLYFASGYDDKVAQYRHVLEFESYIKGLGLNPTCDYAPGGHNWDFWNAQLTKIFRFFFENNDQ